MSFLPSVNASFPKTICVLTSTLLLPSDVDTTCIFIVLNMFQFFPHLEQCSTPLGALYFHYLSLLVLNFMPYLHFHHVHLDISRCKPASVLLLFYLLSSANPTCLVHLPPMFKPYVMPPKAFLFGTLL